MKEITLSNEVVCLRSMEILDADGIFAAAQDERIWRHMTQAIDSKESTVQYIQQAITVKKQGTEYPFVIIDQLSKEIIGSTRFLDIDLVHKRLEIGSTWINPSYWRSSVNTNCKFLLLQYGFEVLMLQRIQLKTDHENYRSQQAIERIGAVKEGVLRNHMIRTDGTVRHTVMYSITAEEWPVVKNHLLNKMNSH